MKKIIGLLLVAALAIACWVPAWAAQQPAAVDHLLINQTYGGGGKGDTPISHSFIELYNPHGAKYRSERIQRYISVKPWWRR